MSVVVRRRRPKVSPDAVEDVARRVRRAFARLRMRNVVAREKHTCCRVHAEESLRKHLASLAQDVRDALAGVVFFTQNDEEYWRRRNKLYIAYSPVGVATEKDLVRVGNLVVKALREQGLAVQWSGSGAERIVVVGVDDRRMVN